ncbi:MULTISPECIES: capping complex subunit for YIEGIA [Bacillaceae]|uniref:capping complex subunit for YIEGIA n=1 Tax=Bacillaceae TaxID=186817 RepID=UPI0030006013
MAKESNMKPDYKIIAYLTSNEERKVTGAPLFLSFKTEEELKDTTLEIAKALKAEIVKLKNNDYLIIRA